MRARKQQTNEKAHSWQSGPVTIIQVHWCEEILQFKMVWLVQLRPDELGVAPLALSSCKILNVSWTDSLAPSQLESNPRLCFILLVTFTALEANVHSVSKDKGPQMFLDKPATGPLWQASRSDRRGPCRKADSEFLGSVFSSCLFSLKLSSHSYMEAKL